MKWLKKLDNPMLLVLQGMVAGTILFAATHADAFAPQPEPTISVESLR